jgi:hypothetical protein
MAKGFEPNIQACSDAAKAKQAEPLAGHAGLYIAILIASVGGVLVYRESPLAFLATMTDGLLAAAVLAAAALAGLWIVWGSGNGDLPVRWQIGLGAGAGIGALSLGMLWAGLRGWMGQTTWWVVIGVMAAAGLLALQRLSQRREPACLIDLGDPLPTRRADRSLGLWQWLWLLIIPVVVLGVLAASVPPGWLWEEEANGYDVLEYHLGAPRDWFFSMNPVTHTQGQIVYLDHNMYSNFPMNAEMLYLLSMVLLGSPWKAAVVAQFISLLQGALCGYVAWLIGRDYSPRAGIVTGLAGAGLPWLAYFGALAYVENGMLFYGLLAAGLCNRAIRDFGERHWSRALMLGLTAGLACGYKYTAIPMIAVPMLLLWAVLAMSGPRRSLSLALIPMIIAAAAFAPWAAKNQRMTGNPLFPLANSVFGSRVWTEAQNAKFVEAHRPLPAERPVSQRFAKLWQRVITEPRFGYLPWIVAGLSVALLAWRGMCHRRQLAIWLAVLAMEILLWMFTTHLYARFAGVLWIPLILLIAPVAALLTQDRKAGRQGEGQTGRKAEEAKAAQPDAIPAMARAWRPNMGMAVCVLGLVLYGIVGQGWLWDEYNRHLRPRGTLLPIQGAPELFYHGRIPTFDHLRYINGNGKDEKGLPFDAKLLMVGDARVYYVGRQCDYWVTFSSSPFVDAVQDAGGKGGAILDWLRRQGYSHVYADFGEMQRLSQTYGFALPVDVALFERLEAAGLRRLHEVQDRPDHPPYGILYKVPAP